jgi:BRCA1/BRCA2-containing complex subunit 3
MNKNSSNLKRVLITNDVIHSCLSHSLSTETTEIMGVLLGHFEEQEDGTCIAIVEKSMSLNRKFKEKDRVEVSAEDLAKAALTAEKMSELEEREFRVISWYHSHPHISVYPSHVDVKTQCNFQSLDKAFFGVIFSVFDKGNISLCAFQSCNHVVSLERSEIPITVVNKLSDIRMLSYLNSTPLTNDSLLAHQIIQLNELKLMNEKNQSYLSNNSSQQLSYSEILLSSNSYQQSLLKLIDLQLSPLETSIQSKIDSLKSEKVRLQEILSQLEVSNINNNNNNNEIDQNDSMIIDNNINNNEINKGYKDNKFIQAIILSNNYSFTQSCEILKSVLYGFSAEIPITHELNILEKKETTLYIQRNISNNINNDDDKNNLWNLSFNSFSLEINSIKSNNNNNLIFEVWYLNKINNKKELIDILLNIHNNEGNLINAFELNNALKLNVWPRTLDNDV